MSALHLDLTQQGLTSWLPGDKEERPLDTQMGVEGLT